MTDKHMWIGPDEMLKVGDFGFLIEKSHDNHGWTRYELCDTPEVANISREPRLYGWCGSYNNLSTTGCGMYRVKRVAKNSRCYIEQLEGAELAAALEDLGYPELYSEEEKLQEDADRLIQEIKAKREQA